MSIYLLDCNGQPLREKCYYKMCLPDRRELAVAYSPSNDRVREVLVGPANSGFVVFFEDRVYWESETFVHITAIAAWSPYLIAPTLTAHDGKLWLTRDELQPGWTRRWCGRVMSGRNFLFGKPEEGNDSEKILVGDQMETGFNEIHITKDGYAYFEVEFVPVVD